MRTPSYRAFVLRHTGLRPVPGLEHVRLHLGDQVLAIWHAVQVETGDPEAALPYWAFAWAGGLAIARHLLEHPGTVAGRRVIDLGSGSGLCAVAAALAGARSVTAIDVDPFAGAAIGLNARANRCRIRSIVGDVLDSEPPPADVVLAGDCWYEGAFAGRVTPWLERAHDRGAVVLVGDPGRAHLPTDRLVELATYPVTTTTELEDLAQKRAGVYAIAPGPR